MKTYYDEIYSKQYIQERNRMIFVTCSLVFVFHIGAAALAIFYRHPEPIMALLTFDGTVVLLSAAYKVSKMVFPDVKDKDL